MARCNESTAVQPPRPSLNCKAVCKHVVTNTPGCNQTNSNENINLTKFILRNKKIFIISMCTLLCISLLNMFIPKNDEVLNLQLNRRRYSRSLAGEMETHSLMSSNLVRDSYVVDENENNNLCFLTHDEVESFINGSDVYIFLTDDIKDKIKDAVNSKTKKNVFSNIFYGLCELHNKKYIKVADLMYQKVMMLSNNLNIPKKEQLKCWYFVYDVLIKKLFRFDNDNRSAFKGFMRKKPSNEEFTKFIKERLYLFNEFSRDTIFMAFNKLQEQFEKFVS
ncbi:Plasmodium exported protein, unknown function [Plasmodium malariae]|uniref:Plasmodium RESA N-terminal domain-containing protein n=1 Tax=Plasmodium malariae TaxID=5858 RepID=A0A1C3K9Q5_PLAMA|nr:Plasmodium exported protein, unknown function [Plasmodium malariae]